MRKYKMVAKGLLEIVLCTIVVTTIPGCAEDRGLSPRARIYHVPFRDMGEGYVHAFITMDNLLIDRKPFF